MLFDKENMFHDKASSLGNGDTIANVGGGDAANPLFLVVHLGSVQTAKLKFTLQTDDNENFSNAVNLGVYETPVGAVGVAVSAKIPYGCKKFIRLVSALNNSTEGAALVGKVSAGLTETVPNWKY